MKKKIAHIDWINKFNVRNNTFYIRRFLLLVIFVKLVAIQGVDAQDTIALGCNRSVNYPSLLKDLPKDICLISSKDQIKYIFNKTDINGDSLNDCIIKYGRADLNDGDTLFTAIYFQNNDSTYFLFKIFNNLYPIYLRSYNDLYTPEEEELKILQKNYYYRYPLYELKIEKDKIIFLLKNDAESNLIITYQYDKDLKNWKYIDCIESFFYNDGINKLDFSNELGPTIDNFKYTF